MNKSNHFDVSEYSFRNLKGAPPSGETSTYEFQDINSVSPKQAEEHQETIKIERAHAEKSNFKVAPIVREHRGMIQQEETERENQIQNEVNRRILLLEEEAYKKGFEKGQHDGREEVFRETQAATDEKLQSLNEMITDVLKVKAEMLKEERLQVYETIKTLTKWIVLRELKEDGAYIERLLEKLILEMQTKSNLLIQVNPSSFESMPEVLDQIQKRMGELTNVRVEMDHDTDNPGVLLHSENGILNGRLGVQFKNLDKLFSNVGLPFSDDATLDLEVQAETETQEVISEEITTEEIIETDNDEEPNE